MCRPNSSDGRAQLSASAGRLARPGSAFAALGDGPHIQSARRGFGIRLARLPAPYADLAVFRCSQLIGGESIPRRSPF